jgi:hypothetical protein
VLEWIHHDKLPMYLAKSQAAKAGDFRIFYDDTMYWDTFSGLSPTQNLDAIKREAEKIHNEFNQLV